MTRRRLLTIVVAVLLTVFGTVILIAYVSSAEQRARQGQELTTVLVPTKKIEASVPATDLAERVTTEEVPRDMRPQDAVSSLDELGNRVTTAELLPGEPLRAGRFQPPDRAQPSGGTAIPEGMQIVTVALEPQRALGGRVRKGQLVGVILSMDQAEIPNPDNQTETVLAESATGMMLNRVLVTNVSGAIDEESEQAEVTVMISLALDRSDAERLVFGAEHGRIWLTEQNADTPTLGGQFRTRNNIFEAVDTEG
jgi:pilus assembly protein CpaB